MSIVTKIQDLKDFLEKKLHIQVYIGEQDIAADNYPVVLLIPSLSGEVNETFGKNAKNIEFPILIRIISHRKKELEALRILDKLIENERLFQPETKNELTTISPSYDTNTYSVDCTFILNNLIRKAV